MFNGAAAATRAPHEEHSGRHVRRHAVIARCSVPIGIAVAAPGRRQARRLVNPGRRSRRLVLAVQLLSCGIARPVCPSGRLPWPWARLLPMQLIVQGRVGVLQARGLGASCGRRLMLMRLRLEAVVQGEGVALISAGAGAGAGLHGLDVLPQGCSSHRATSSDGLLLLGWWLQCAPWRGAVRRRPACRAPYGSPP